MPPKLPQRPLRVLHMTIAMSRGGRRDAILALARAGRSEQLIPHLATLRSAGEDGGLEGEFESTTDLGIPKLPRLADIRKLARTCNKLGIDVVHTHDASSQYVASMLHCVAPRLRVVMTYHRTLDFESRGFRNQFRNTISLPLVSRVITATGERRHHFLRLNRIAQDKLAIIPLGIDVDRFQPNAHARLAVRQELGLPSEGILVVAAGHFGPEKGIDNVLEAVGRAAAPGGLARIRLAILGTGTPEQIANFTSIGQRWLGDAVTFLGFRSDPERIFAAADLLVHLPRLESFGLVMVQAMACGVPVVASAVGGIPEVVRAGETGLLAPSADPVTSAPLIERLLSDAELRNALGAGALRVARSEHSAALYAQRHRELYQAIMPRSRWS